MNSSTERSSYLLRTTKVLGVALFAVTAFILIPGCGGGDTNTGSEDGLTAMSANPKGTQSARNPGPQVAWSPDSLYASLAPGGSTMFQVEFTPSVNATGVTTFVVPEIADHVLLNPSSFASLAAGQTYSIDVTLTSPPGMEVAEKDGVIMLRQGRRALAKPLKVDLAFVPKTYTTNDTGIDWCADSSSNFLPCPVAGHPGQDGDHGRDALARLGQLAKVGAGSAGFDWTKLDTNGEPLAIQNMPWSDGGSETDGNRWSCVRDNVTGLVWEIKVNDSTHLRHQGHTYTWYDPDSPDGNTGTQNGGTCIGSDCDTTGFVEAVNAQDLCGASDWRMPTRGELQGIVDYGRFMPSIDPGYFPNTQTWFFWSGSPSAGNSSYARVVYFYSGFAASGLRRDAQHVRLVRGGQ